MLEAFITSRIRRKIVVLFSKHPDYRRHVRGIADLIGEDPGNIQRELIRLEDVGFLTHQEVKNTKEYRANQDFPLYKELQALVLKSQSLKPKTEPKQTDVANS